MPSVLPTPIVAAFSALTLALAALWLARASPSRPATCAWMVPGALALAFGLAGGLVDLTGVSILLAFAATCVMARRSAGAPVGLVWHAILLTLGAGLFVHILPGMHNPRVLSDVVLGPDAMPYTKYLNFDKGVAGLFLLGLYAPDLPTSDEGVRRAGATARRLVLVVAVVLALSLAVGYVRWDPKLPPWWPLWLWSMVFLTALPEEAAFRGVVQTAIARRLGDTRRGTVIAVLAAGVLFGLAHIAGGTVYIALASAAGIGYGWIYASSRSIGAAIVTHAGLNTIHFFLFTYPALARLT